MHKIPLPPTEKPSIPYGYCECGCGQKTKISSITRKNRGWIKGEPKRFIAKHKTTSPIDCLLDSKSGCWNWQKAKTPHGYGVLRLDGNLEYAHRYYYKLAYGEIEEGMHICHKCDNPSCVNPEHLFAGTRSDNLSDCVNKGRHVSVFRNLEGVKNNQSKMTPDKVSEIRQLAKAGVSQRKIARQFGIAQSTAGAIIRRETWKHVDYPV